MEGPQGEVPSWWYQTLVELAVPALYACCTKVYQCSQERKLVKHTRECFRKASAAFSASKGKDEESSIAGLRQLLVEFPSQQQQAPLCLIRGAVAGRGGGGGTFPFWGNTDNNGEPVIRLHTKEVRTCTT